MTTELTGPEKIEGRIRQSKAIVLDVVEQEDLQIEEEIIFFNQQSNGPSETILSGSAGPVKVKLIGTLPITEPVPTTGTVISFAKDNIFGTRANPVTGNITHDLQGAKLGIVQKVYHQGEAIPSFPANWIKLGNVDYVANMVNVIYAEWCGGNDIEYWITL